MGTFKVGRDAGSGRFVKPVETRLHPGTSILETVTTKPPRRKPPQKPPRKPK
jgi:hypothetical protein